MTFLPFRFTRPTALVVAVASCAIALVACGGKAGDDDVPCVPKTAPPIFTTAMTARIDVLDLGERRDPVPSGSVVTGPYHAVSYGFDLDGKCSDGKNAETLSCRSTAGAARDVVTDGDGGVDNGFGRTVLSMLEALHGEPSRKMSGFSYLETQTDGRGTLYLGGAGGLQVIVPLTEVRIGPAESDGLRSLSAVAPLDAFLASVRGHINLLLSDEYCKGATLDEIVRGVANAADIRADGASNPDAVCDAVSIGIRLRTTPVDRIPEAVPQACPTN